MDLRPLVDATISALHRARAKGVVPGRRGLHAQFELLDGNDRARLGRELRRVEQERRRRARR